MRFRNIALLISVVNFLGLFACKSVKIQDVTYVRNLPDSIKEINITATQYHPPIIQVDDNLNINIQTIDPTATASFNGANLSAISTALSNLGVIGTSNTTTGAVTGNATSVSGFIVDSKGNVYLPLIGSVKLGGLSIEQARDTITSMALKYYKDPVVNVQFTNFRINVLGEVAKPSTYVVPSPKISIFDAIGFAGDLTIYGRRDNILLIRSDSNNQKKFIRLNLNSSDIFTSPYFYLKQNDVVYVQTNKAKVVGSDVISSRFLTYLSIALTLILAISSRIK